MGRLAYAGDSFQTLGFAFGLAQPTGLSYQFVYLQALKEETRSFQDLFPTIVV